MFLYGKTEKILNFVFHVMEFWVKFSDVTFSLVYAASQEWFDSDFIAYS